MAKSKDTQVESAMKTLQAALMQRYEQQSAILRQGDRIIIPEFMSFRDAADAILSHEQKMEEQMQTLSHFDAHPNDAMVALTNAIHKTYGTLLGAEQMSFFGKIPGRSLTVPVGYGKTMVVPFGDAEVPGLPVKMSIRPQFDETAEVGGSLDVIFSYQRKYEPLIKQIEALTNDELKNNSIFRGKAIDSKFEFMNVENFDETRVVYSKDEKRQIMANIISPIANSAAWEAAGSSLRRGILLHGEYGTGKTLTALLTGKYSVQNGWTFINVLPGDDIVRALKFAKRYQPAVVFFEDIDNDTSGPRNDRINSILNTIDGLLSKDGKLITILTTNHIDSISKGMLRPGRLDSIIKMGVLDEESVVELIRVVARDMNGNSIVEGDLDSAKIWEVAQGFMPAFVAEAVTKAKAYALVRSNGGRLSITGQDVIDALVELRPQYDKMREDQVVSKPNIETALEETVHKVVADMEKKISNVYSKLN